MEGVGNEFLRIVQDEFINRNKNTGYGQLLASFTRDGKENVWRYEDDYCTLEVGTSVSYAVYVNSGHRTSAEGKNRFVPGYWQGDRFIYDPSAEGGMMLKFHWVKGLYFWEAATHAMERMLPTILEKKLQEWIDNYFDG